MEGILVILNLAVTIIGLIGLIIKFSNRFVILEKKVDLLNDEKKIIENDMGEMQSNFNKLMTEIALLRKDFQLLNNTLLTTVTKLDNIIDVTNDNKLKISNIQTSCKFNHKNN